MKKMFKKSILITLTIAIILTNAVACKTDGGSKPANTTTNTLDDDIINPVDISDIVVEDKKELANPNLTYIGFYDMRTAVDIKPSVKLFEETYGGKIDYLQIGWGERVDRLATLISSGDSPDLVDVDDNTFPHLMSKNMYSDLTEYIDLSKPQWSGMQELIESYRWDGKQFYYPWHAQVNPYYIFYNETLFEEYAIESPRELYAAGNWTWDTFKECMVKFMDSAPDAIGGYYGMHGLNFIHSTGSTIISIDNGKLVNNMKNANVERAAQFLEDLRKQGLTISGGNTEALGTGKLAFYAMGIWEFWGLDGNYPEYSFNVVPYPRDPSADKYYLSTYTFGYLVPSGSKNVEGAAEFINMIRNSKVDPEMRAITRQSELSTVIEGTNRAEIYDFCDTFTEIGNFDYVTDACTGFTDVTTTINDILYNVTFATGENMKTWTQLRTENEGLINAGLETYNSGLTE